MEALRNNIDHYMKRKGIRMYTHLLVDIAHELGIKGKEAYDFANREKSNFSKMLKGERPLKHEFIVPLEKIFGVSLARLLDEEGYKLPGEKDNVPFNNKGFSYYAYLDDPKLYRKEFDPLRTRDGSSILTQTDEFGKAFLDYVVEYHSVHGVRYLYEEYGIKLKWYHRQFELEKKREEGIRIYSENYIEFARLVASMNDAELFYDIFDSYHMFLSNGHYASEDTIFCQGEYLEIILDNDHLFRSLFETREYQYVVGNFVKRERQVESILYRSINPIINNCLRYALKHVEKYRQQAITILEFGIRHNAEIQGKHGGELRVCNELGGLMEMATRGRKYNVDVVDIEVFVDCEVEDDEVNSLIQQLPRFPKYD